MVKHRGGSSPLKMEKYMIIVSFVSIVLLFVMGSISMAQEDEKSYDPNTEVSIRGKITEIIIRQKGPVIIGFAGQQKIYQVLISPRWYIESEKIELKTGDELVVNGAKFFSRTGEIFIIAREIKNITTGKIYTLRDESLRPLWRGKGKHKSIEY